MELDLIFPPGVSKVGEDLIRKIVVEDPDARLGGAGGLQELKDHAYFADVVYIDAHKKPAPVPSLGGLCLQCIGRKMLEFRPKLAEWPGKTELSSELSVVLERMDLIQKWQDDCTPHE